MKSMTYECTVHYVVRIDVIYGVSLRKEEVIFFLLLFLQNPYIGGLELDLTLTDRVTISILRC